MGWTDATKADNKLLKKLEAYGNVIEALVMNEMKSLEKRAKNILKVMEMRKELSEKKQLHDEQRKMIVQAALDRIK